MKTGACLLEAAIVAATIVNSLGQTIRPGSLDLSFDPAPGTTIGGEELRSASDLFFLPLVVQPDSKLWISGYYSQGTRFGGRLNQDGSLDVSVSPDAGPPAWYHFRRGIGVQSDGRAIVWGFRPDLVNSRDLPLALDRINHDGSIDATFQTPDESTCCDRLIMGTVQPDDRIVLVFGESGSRFSVIRLTALGKLDDSFKEFHISLGEYLNIRAIALQKDGKILLGGYQVSQGISRPVFLRLFPNGELDTEFKPPIGGESDHRQTFNPAQEVKSILVQPDGKLIVSGHFSIQNNASHTNLARLHPDGSLDISFARSAIPTDEFDTVAVLQEDGKIILSSVVWSADSSFKWTLTRLNPDGSLDMNFDPVTANGTVDQMAFQPDGKLLVAGNFWEIDGVKRRSIARLYLDPVFKFGPLRAPVNGELSLNLNAEPGKTYILQTSTNLTDWLPLHIDSATNFTLELKDTNAAKFPHRFYRARLVD